ncbi:MAG: class II aldolase/adducin family protein [Candidatus Kryptoniota bacterium]
MSKKVIVKGEVERGKREIVKVCHLLAENGFVAATDGNVSTRLSDGTVLITASSLNKREVSISDIVSVRPDGKFNPSYRKPSTEYAMHNLIYKVRSDVRAVVHAHPVFATAFAAVRLPMDKKIFPEVIVTFGKIPVANYATPSTSEVPDSIRDLVTNYDAILLANHGVVTCGVSLIDAYNKMEKVEHTAKVLWVSKLLGGAKELSSEELMKLAEASERNYGKKVKL